MSDEPKTKPITDTDIVAGLRSDDPKRRQVALDALTAGPGSFGAIFVHAQAMQSAVSSTSTLDAGRLFTAMLFLAQQLGAQVGLQLGWVPRQPGKDEIIVPT